MPYYTRPDGTREIELPSGRRIVTMMTPEELQARGIQPAQDTEMARLAAERQLNQGALRESDLQQAQSAASSGRRLQMERLYNQGMLREGEMYPRGTAYQTTSDRRVPRPEQRTADDMSQKRNEAELNAERLRNQGALRESDMRQAESAFGKSDDIDMRIKELEDELARLRGQRRQGK